MINPSLDVELTRMHCELLCTSLDHVIKELRYYRERALCEGESRFSQRGDAAAGCGKAK